MTICDVLLKFSERFFVNGIRKVIGYDTVTFTRFPGALQVPVLHDDHVVGVVPLAEYHDVDTPTFEDVIAGNPSPCT